jgi:hypothetical protein
VKLLPVVAVLIVASIALAGFAAYEYSQSSYENGVASGLSTQVSSLSNASSNLQAQLVQARANLTSLTALRDSLQAQLVQANSNSAALQNQIGTLNAQITQLKSQISNDESLLNLSVTNTLISAQTFNLPPAGSGSTTSTTTVTSMSVTTTISTSLTSSASTTFPFVSVSAPRSWGDVGVVVTSQTPATPPSVSQTGTQDCVFSSHPAL